jgi:hypothetical protein
MVRAKKRRPDEARPTIVFDAGAAEAPPYHARRLLDVAARRAAGHRLVGVERVFDLPIEVQILLARLRRRRRRWRFFLRAHGRAMEQLARV